MQQFKIKPGGFEEIRKATLVKTIPIALIAVGIGFAISHFNSNGATSGADTLIFVIPIMLGALSVGLYSGIKRQKQIFESYTLTVDTDAITREQYNTPPITIVKSEIMEINKNPNGSFTIKGNSMLNMIGVPAQIDNYETLERSLGEMKPVSDKSKVSFLQRFRLLLVVLPLGLMAAVYLSGNKLVVGLSGTILLALLGYSFFVIQKSKNVDRRTKRGMWLAILVLLSIIGVMYFKLTRQH